VSDQEKAKRLFERASRVMTYPEIDLCWRVFNGQEGGDKFARLCERLEIYLR
jgi:hypothetical protein